MPKYFPIRFWKDAAERSRTAANLLKLRSQIAAQMPRRTHGATLLLGTWNLRNFDDNRFAHGPRLPESLHYISEIISAFDILAVQEICEDLGPLDKLMEILGGQYRYITTDVSDYVAGGNKERMTFIFDSGKVNFQSIAGELVLSPKNMLSEETGKSQFARTPFMCAFQSGWFKFMFATVHIYYGEDSPGSDGYKRRVSEIKSVARELRKRADAEEQNYILVGDFNIVDHNDPTADALGDKGFDIFRNNIGSNSDQTKFYDQISFRSKNDEMHLVQAENAKGVLNIFENLFTAADAKTYEAPLRKVLEAQIERKQIELAKTTKPKQRAKIENAIAATEAVRDDDALRQKYFLEDWRTFQLSDHMPLWVELEIDFSDGYLAGLRDQV